MAKASINVCDHCGAWDSEQTPVVKVGVAGVNFQLCPTRRAELLVSMGIEEQRAERYVKIYDVRKNHPEIKLSMGGLDRIWNELFPEPALNGVPDQAPENGQADAVDLAEESSTTIESGGAGGDDGVESGVDTEVAVTRPRARKR